MRRLMLAAGAAALLVGVGYAGAAITAPAPAAPAPAAAHHHRVTTTCGWLRDGVGHGSALSAKPGHPVTEGQIATVQSTSDTWSVCQNSSNPATIWLESAPGYCLADFGGHAIWEGCGGNNPELWTVHPQSGGGYELRDQTQGFNLDICASDGVGSQVISTGRTGCSPYHRTWLFSQARKTG